MMVQRMGGKGCGCFEHDLSRWRRRCGGIAGGEDVVEEEGVPMAVECCVFPWRIRNGKGRRECQRLGSLGRGKLTYLDLSFGMKEGRWEHGFVLGSIARPAAE